MAKTVFNRNEVDFTKEPMFFGADQNVHELGELVDPGIFLILLGLGDDRIRLLTECSAFFFATAHSFLRRSEEGDAWEPGLVCIDKADALGPAPQSDLAALNDVPGGLVDIIASNRMIKV